ncbi:MAG: tetratricopeptide repeat protein [Firmicutes bacterium]|nr:tetratricopeptide repeat protein [Bacillota bacterium]
MAEEKSMELKRQINRSTEIGNLDEALEALNSLMEIDGESAFAYNKLGIISARRGDMINAKAYFEKALALDPQYAQAYSNLGNVYREAGDLGQAIAYYQQAINCDSQYATAYHNLGVVYKQKGDIQKAVENLKQANKLQRVMARRELADSPVGRVTPIAWLIVAIVIIALIYITRR